MNSESRPVGEHSTASPALLWVLCLIPFCLVATANSAGYRFGASDLAFYGPAVMRELDPSLFPRDTQLIDAQAQLTLMDETVAAIAELTTESFPRLFLSLYLLTLAIFAFGGSAIGASLYRSRWAIVGLLAALAMRHAIAGSGTNTLEAYFHPRQLAFALCTLAVAAFLRGRMALVLPPLAGAAALHPTTTLWFAMWLGVAVFVAEPRWRPHLAATALGLGLAVTWALLAGPLAGRLVIMDAEWLGAIAEKEYLFPLEWPLDIWLLNLSYVPAIYLIHRWRTTRHLASARETALVIGCLSLVPVFVVFLALNAARLALAIQLQPARIFWLLDFLAIVYAVWALSEGARLTARRPQLAAASLMMLAALRGLYVMEVEFPERPLFEVNVPGDWGRVAAWAQSTRADSGWLADPMHAARYGTSLRMAAERDVFVEALKDGALGMYDRDVALRTRQRVEAIGDFETLSAGRAQQLGSQHALDYLVTERAVALPLAFHSGLLKVYRLR